LARHERKNHQSVEDQSKDTSDRSTHKPKDQKPTAQEDCINNYHTARMTFGLIMMLFTDSVKEGDIKRLLPCLKVFLLMLHTQHRVKYSYVVLLFLAKVKSILPSGIAYEVMHNRFFNTSGKPGGNIPLDLRMEHLNKLLKIALKQLGSNISETGAQRIATGLDGLERLISNVHNDTMMQTNSGYHSSKHLKEIVFLITEDLINEKVFVHEPGRHYQSFKKFKSDMLHKLDNREFFRWVRHLFKVWDAMYY